MTTVVASVLRSLNIPTKLIDGFYIKDNPKMRHSWNEVYLNSKWVPFDITRKDFKIGEYHIKKTEHTDWSELEE
jgi:transglutaminase-like putative cysteine protease